MSLNGASGLSLLPTSFTYKLGVGLKNACPFLFGQAERRYMNGRKLIIFLLIVLFLQVNASIGADERMSLKEADEHANYILSKLHYEEHGRLRDAGIYVDPYDDPDYKEMIEQLHNLEERYGKKTIKATVIKMAGYDYGLEIVYILEHYDDWLKMKGKK
jgi:hypothetical protein